MKCTHRRHLAENLSDALMPPTAGLPTLPKPLPTGFAVHITVLDWPANSSDLYLIENPWSIVKRKMRDTRPNNADELKAIKATWASKHCHRLIASMLLFRTRQLQVNGKVTFMDLKCMCALRTRSCQSPRPF